MPTAKSQRRSSGRVLRWLRRFRPVFLVLWAALIYWFMVSPAPRRIPGLGFFLRKLEALEDRSLDLRFRWRGAEPAHPGIVIVTIDKPIISAMEVPAEDLARSPALQAMSESYQASWRHVVWAEAIERLMQFGAKVVVFDVIFTRQSSDVVRAQRVMQELVHRLEHPGWLPPFPTQFLGLEKIAAIVGADGVKFRQAVDRYGNQLVLGMSMDVRGQEVRLLVPHESLAPEDYENLLGNVQFTFDKSHGQEFRSVQEEELVARWATHRWVDDSLLIDVKSIDALAVQKYNGTLAPNVPSQYIRYQGPRRTYPYVPLSTLFIERELAEPPFDGGKIFQDKIVYIGATYELAHDDKNTPFGIMPGVEVHANMAADLLMGSRLHDVAGLTGHVLTAAMVVIPALLVLLLRNALGQTLGILCFMVGYGVACHLAFSYGNLVLPMMVGIFGPVTVGGAGVIYSFFLEQREKAHIRKVFNRFVSTRVAGIVLKNAEEIEQASRGEKRPVAILFSDIRSFTTWSENAPPENLVGQLNEYFERMVGHVEESEGTVQKFIGDAILAAWGDTHSNGFAEDCRRAVVTVLKMRTTLQELNRLWDARQDRITISIGMGINHGEVVVGEVGHPERREYTVLGDGVNFGARLESATKQFHTDCLIGESVEALTREHFIFRHADFIRVKGKKKPVNVFFLISDRTVPPPGWLSDYHEARRLYLQRQFAEAAALFESVKAQISGEDFLCEMYLKLCAKFQQDPPPPAWDGSRELTEK